MSSELISDVGVVQGIIPKVRKSATSKWRKAIIVAALAAFSAGLTACGSGSGGGSGGGGGGAPTTTSGGGGGNGGGGF